MIAEKQKYKGILLKIREAEPLPSWCNNFYNSSMITSITLLYISAVVFMAWWSYDFYEKTRLCKFEYCGLDSYLLEPGYEYAILAVLLSSLVYLLYRSTDWPFVKERMLIILILTFLGFSLSGSTIIWLKAGHDPITNELLEIKESIKTYLPWRHGVIGSQTSNELKPISGIVEESTKESLKIATSLRHKVSLFYESSFPNNLKPKIGSRVVVQIKLLDNALYVESIEEL
jgi:hypothetical protein